MSERTVQVPVSLIEEAPHGEGCFFKRLSNPIPADCDCWKANIPAQVSSTSEVLEQIRADLSLMQMTANPDDAGAYVLGRKAEAIVFGNALLSQPTANACEWCEETATGTAFTTWSNRGHASFGQHGHEFTSWITQPPRIEDMAPGTTFWARTRDGVLSRADRFWMVAEAGFVFSTGAHFMPIGRIDTSTIRDVTSPKDAA